MPRLTLPVLIRRSILTATIVVGSLSAFHPAQAIEPGKEGELVKLVPPKDGARACYARVYEKKHLADHPDQKVTQMEFRLTYYQQEPESGSPPGGNYLFQLRAKLRGQARAMTTMGECMPSGKGIWCGVECDGGGVMIEKRSGNKLLVDLESTGRIRMTEACGDEEEDSVELEPGLDDKTFLLSQLSPAKCPIFEDW